MLLINIEKQAVISIIPNRIFLGDWPNGERSTRARLLSKLNFAEPSAKKNPPRKSMRIGSARQW